MKKEEKYCWMIGCPPPELQQHSAVKHKIIESYVRNYILTLMAQATIPKLQLTLVDGFAGGGCYLSEGGQELVDGSPLMMLRAVREARAHLNLKREKPREVSVDYEFIDVNPPTVAYLRHWIDCRRQASLIDHVDAHRIQIKQSDFLTELPRLGKTIKARKMGQHAIFVLDQYSYNDLPLPNIAEILRNLQGAEVILTFNVGSLTTYLSDHVASRKPIAHIGLDKYVPWEQIKHIKASEGQFWRRALQRHIARGIREESGAKFMTLFFVRPFGKNTWDYWLIHLSNRYKAHEVMKDLHWSSATEFLHELEPGVFVQGYDANNDVDFTGQPSFDFGVEASQDCVNGIREHLGRKLYEMKQPIEFRKLIENCASFSPGSTDHFATATEQLHRSKDLIVVSADGRIRRPSRNYRPDDVIEYSPQIRLFD